MTPDQQKDAERLDRYLMREGLVSVMNQTKWREVVSAIKDATGSMAGNLRFRVKSIRSSEATAKHWQIDFPEHFPQPYKVIEWLEIDPFVGRSWTTRPGHDFTEALVEAFNTNSIPFHRNGEMLRIDGYTRVA